MAETCEKCPRVKVTASCIGLKRVYICTLTGNRVNPALKGCWYKPKDKGAKE